jgi:hypothetical protein
LSETVRYTGLGETLKPQPGLTTARDMI